MRVTRGSTASLNSGPERWLSACTAARRASASTTIVRNLTMLKLTPLRPTRSWRNRTGPPSSRLTRMATRANTGAATSSRAPATTMSNARLRKRLATEGVDGATRSSASLATAETVMRLASMPGSPAWTTTSGPPCCSSSSRLARSSDPTAPEQTTTRSMLDDRSSSSVTSAISPTQRCAMPAVSASKRLPATPTYWTPASGWTSPRRTSSAARRSVPITSVRWTKRPCARLVATHMRRPERQATSDTRPATPMPAAAASGTSRLNRRSSSRAPAATTPAARIRPASSIERTDERCPSQRPCVRMATTPTRAAPTRAAASSASASPNRAAAATTATAAASRATTSPRATIWRRRRGLATATGRDPATVARSQFVASIVVLIFLPASSSRVALGNWSYLSVT